jgi:hypothetical protein
MTERKAPKSYWALAIVPLFSVGLWLLEKYVDEQSWWHRIPWRPLLIGWAIFTAGVLFRDSMAPGSWLRGKFRRLVRSFEIETIATAYHTRPTHREWLAVTIHLRFTRTLRKAHLLVRVSADLNIPHVNRQFLLQQLSRDRINSSHKEKLVVAILPLTDAPGTALGPQCWSDHYREPGDIDGLQSLSQGTDNIVDIEVRSNWWLPQRERIFLVAMSTKSMEFGRVFIAYDDVPAALAMLR